MAAPAAGAIPRRRGRFVPRQLHAGVRRRGGVRHDRRGGGRAGAGGGVGDRARPVCRRRTAAATSCHAAGAGPCRAHRHGRRRRPGDRHRHCRQGTERGAPRRAGVRGRRVGQLPVRAADAVLEAMQHRRHRARHDRRHAGRRRPRAGVAQHDLSEGREGGGAEGARRPKPPGARCSSATLASARRGQGRPGEDRPGRARQGRRPRRKDDLERSSRARRRSLVGLEKPLFDAAESGPHLDPARFPRRASSARCSIATSAPRTCGTSCMPGRTRASLRPRRQRTEADGSSRGRGHPRRPLTPPYVRFRIRRFKQHTGEPGGCPPD